MTKKLQFPIIILKDWQKLTIAITSTLLIVGIGGGSYFWYTSSEIRTNVSSFFAIRTQQRTTDGQLTTDGLERLKDTLKQAEPTKDFYKDYTLVDLDIFPNAWIKRFFNESERRNALFAGPQADPDKDGLTNKEEYFYGSNPLKAKTLCDGVTVGNKPSPSTPYACDSKNDKQMVESELSPLSGFQLDTPPVFRVLNQDITVINSLKDSFEKAAEEGIDFPVLFELSRSINLSEEFNSFKIIEQEDKAENILKYRQLRLDVLDDFVSDNELSSLAQIYQATRPEQLKNLKGQYQKQFDKLNASGVPKKYLSSHRAYLMIFKKLIDLVAFRENGLTENKTNSSDFQVQSKQKAVEVVWGYKRLSEELAKLKE